jgi:hypothetical protein
MTRLRIQIALDLDSGIWQGSSIDMPGLLIFDKTRERVAERLPEVASGLAQARGQQLRFSWDGPNELVGKPL